MKTNLLVILAIVAAVILTGLYFGAAQAGGYHHHITNEFYETTEINGIDNSDYHSGLSQMLAMDAIHCSTSTKKHQMGVGTGYSNGKNGFAVGYCKTSVTDNGIPVMFNGAAAIGNGAKPKYSLGVNFTF